MGRAVMRWLGWLLLAPLPMAAAQSGDAVDAHLGKAYSYQQEQRYEMAAQEFEAALAIDPTHLRARYQLAVCHFALGNRVRARAEFQKVHQESGDAAAAYYLGRLDLLESNFASARRRFEALAADPPFPDTAFYIGLACFELNDMAVAIRWLESASRQAPKDFRVHYRLARAYQETGRAEDARREYALFSRQRQDYQDGSRYALECGEALRSKPVAEARGICRRLYDLNDPDKLTLLAIIFGQSGAFEEAIEPLEAAARLDPGSFEIWHNLGLSYFRLKRYREARAPLEKAVSLRPDFFGSNALLGATLYMLGASEPARTVLKHAAELDPGDKDTADLLSRVTLSELDGALTSGRAAEIDHSVTFLLAQQSSDRETLLRAGALLAEKERFSQAAAVFERCRKLYPRTFEADYNLTLALHALGRHAEALSTLETASPAGRPQQLASEYLRGKVTNGMGKPKDAVRHLEAAFEGDPGQENYGLDLALVYLRLQEYPQAAATLEKSLRAHPDSPFLLLALSVARAVGGAYSGAVESARRLLTREPGNPFARLLVAYSHFMAGEYEQCEKEAASGLTLGSPHPFLYYVHAATLFRLNSADHSRMLEELGAAIRQMPDCALCFVMRSKVHEAAGSDPLAAADLEVVVNRLDPRHDQAWYRLAALYERLGRGADAERARTTFRAIKSEHRDRDADLAREMILQSAGVEKTRDSTLKHHY